MTHLPCFFELALVSVDKPTIADDESVSSDESMLASTYYVQLAHSSVKDYLSSLSSSADNLSPFAFEGARSHGELASSCVAYLKSFRRPLRFTELDDLEHLSFAMYAAKFWIYHLAMAPLGDREDIEMQALPLFESKSVLFRNYSTLRFSKAHKKVARKRYLRYSVKVAKAGLLLKEVRTPLLCASYYGLRTICSRLLQAGADPKGKARMYEGSYLGSPLAAACLRGHEDLVRLFLMHQPLDKLALEEGHIGATIGHHSNVTKLLACASLSLGGEEESSSKLEPGLESN
ncbi:MAG: hypothetical protein M1828_006151 [Chrysothrix sp. TS-e1954]|nr:MAG: hypothetical protein M1828_006151 [Chrysothrix sp. TS-e1954]